MDKPESVGQWTIAQIVQKLSSKLPPSMVEARKQGGATIAYVPWKKIVPALNKYAPGWSWEITKLEIAGDRLYLVGRLTIQSADGLITREATGTETLKEISRDGELREISYGDPSSNAEAMAFRRCAAKFGLGLTL